MKRSLKIGIGLLIAISLVFIAIFLITYFSGNFSNYDFVINSKEDLIEFSNMINRESEPMDFYGKTVALNADIDFNNDKFSPIGNGETHFSGTFKGNNHTISNLSIEGESFVGLFGVTDHATIQDLCIDKVKVNGYGDVGTLVGQSVFSKIDNCKVTNMEMGLTVNPNDDNSVYMGGLIGYNNGDISVNYFEEFNYDDPVALINNCSVQGSINIDDNIQYGAVGGLVGVNHGGSNASKGINSFAKIVGCCSKVDITGSQDNEDAKIPATIIIGGLAGANCDYNGVAGRGALIDSCSSSGNITANTVSAYSWVGGFVGYQFNHQGNATIKNCSATGKVCGAKTLYTEGGFSSTGGFVGCIGGLDNVSDAITEEMTQNSDNFINSLSIENCYNKSEITNETGCSVYTGGFVGSISAEDSNVQIINCYCAADVKDIESDIIKEKAIGSFCGLIELGEENTNSCKIEKCYYNNDLSKFDSISSNEQGATCDISGLTTSGCKQNEGLLKILNGNRNDLSKSGDWNEWRLDSEQENYPVNKAQAVNGWFIFGGNNFMLIGVLAIIVLLVLFIGILFYKNKIKKEK